MLPIKSIDLHNGIHITSSGLPDVLVLKADFPSTGTIEVREAVLNQWLQKKFETRIPLSSIPPKDLIKQKPPILHPKERIEGSDVIVTIMYIAAHIFSLSPLRYTVKCSSLPIEGNWWL